MKFVSALLLALTTFSSLVACAEIPTNTPNPMVSLTISDARCNDVIGSLPTKFEEQEFPFIWVDESQGLLTVGPITEDMESGSNYSIIRQTYSLTVTCGDELTTNIDVGVKLEGLKSDGEWIAITDAPTIEQYAMQFLESLNL